jgi:hypothetical protein
MAKVKYVNNMPTFVDEDSKDDGKLRIGGKTINEILAMGSKSKPSGNIASRIDFSDEKIGPKFRADTKPVKKITKEKVSVETPSGNIGSVDRTADVIGPDMSKVNKEEAIKKPTKELDAMQMAQNLMSRGYNMKKGGKVKAKKMSSGGKVSSASKRADGIATKGKTKGRMI